MEIENYLVPLCGKSSNETRSIIVEPGQGVTDAPIMADDVVCSAKMFTIYLKQFVDDKNIVFGIMRVEV